MCKLEFSQFSKNAGHSFSPALYAPLRMPRDKLAQLAHHWSQLIHCGLNLGVIHFVGRARGVHNRQL
jgi:hypothetical protein